ncbi:MAG: Hsp70 family protein, partial [Bacillota bacterium]
MMQLKDTTDQPSRFIIGIDLGTTNSSMAYVDTEEPAWRVRDVLIPQLVAASTLESRETLPSFHYEAAGGEFPPGALRLPWSTEDPKHAVGFFARDHGTTVPGRLISSAKSWLSHSGVDRTGALLPWHAATDVERLSPVDASARYLSHLRAAWDHQHPQHPLSEQEVVLTVPASFDEVARELTVEAARQAGLIKLTLVEEPQAAFYAWINAQGNAWESQVSAGQKILVVDVGGGTTDFTLIRVRPAEGGKVLFHRIAVGEHLILGGDNLDLALAHHVEQKITPGGKVSPREWGPLLRSCRQVKETLLDTQAPEKLTINLATTGAKLIGGARQVEITRQEVVNLLVEGFLPPVALDAKPAARRSGFQEFGLPYAPDPAITRYLAAFLSAHREAGIDQDNIIKLNHDLARPDTVLFNGGFFASPLLRDRMINVIASWFAKSPDTKGDWTPHVLNNDRLDLAVSRGAAYYGMVRRGRGVRISGGLAHSYYIEVETAEPSAEPSALCLLPAGIEEGHAIHLSRTFNLLIRQPVEFPLYVSATRTTDTPGTLVPV